MNDQLSRRDFVKNTVIGTSAATVTTSAARGFPANERVQLGWIGIGNRASGWLMPPMLKVCPDARNAAVCDLKPDRIELGKKIAQRDKPTGYTDFRKMIDKEKLDGILVVTEPNNHAPIVVPCLEAGFNTFAEKPMDTTVEKVDAIVKAARKSKGFYQIGTQRRYNPGYISSVRVIHGGKYGKVTFLQSHFHWRHQNGARLGERDGWGLVEQAPHHMDVMSWLMKGQHPVLCASMGYNQLGNLPKAYRESHSATMYKFADGAILSYTHLFGLTKHFKNEKLWVFCEKAGIDLGAGMLYERMPEEEMDDIERRIGNLVPDEWNKGTNEELRGFVDQIKSDGKLKPKANEETGRICTLMCIMGRTAMIDFEKNAFAPRFVRWEDLGSTTQRSTA